ncbi:FAD binding domain-containing protein [Streptomyces coacervatus]|uniref:FAD binding domain-containing protein n=1 Tax=Streptomyces coacervatus TaxID=647381 RepID=A0ABP7J258_9ACTN|nr:FAD binding domain-containing protein [Streptomyces coacervatus]MDF2272722.1 FAD binding domain-containing protein [Streptomyces coacervatus]
MLLRLPESVSEAQECLAEGAVPVGGATLIWAGWQRDGFPEQAMSLRSLPEANVIGHGALGAAVVLNRVDERVPEVLRHAAAAVGTGAVRRTATVGGNLVGSTLRCLLPAALVLKARATVLDQDRVYETDLAEVLAKHHLLLSLHWREPLASSYRKLPGDAGGPPPFVVAAAVHAQGGGPDRLHVAVRDGYDVLTDDVPCHAGTEAAIGALGDTPVGTLHSAAWEAVCEHVTHLLARPDSR